MEEPLEKLGVLEIGGIMIVYTGFHPISGWEPFYSIEKFALPNKNPSVGKFY